jgi:hypothetical protein
MDKGSSNSLTTLAMGATTVALLSIAMLGPQIPKASGVYFNPPPQVQTPPPVVQPPRLPPRVDTQPPRFINPIPNPMDVVYPMPGSNVYNTIDPTVGGPAINGVSASKFPGTENLKGPSDYIIVQPEPSTNLQRESEYLVNLNEGTVLASVKRPSNMGLIHTPIGQVAFMANSDAFITFSNGVLRVRNVDGVGAKVRVQVTSGPAAGKVYSVAPGYELVVSDHKLTRADLRPGDGIARRAAQTFEGGYAGVSQYHLESALNQSAVVSELSQKQTDVKSRRVIADMSRMAAVLNQVQGGAGYSKE